MCRHVRDPATGATSVRRDQDRNPSFRCGVHRLDYTVAGTPRHIILNTHRRFETPLTVINVIAVFLFKTQPQTTVILQENI